MIVVRLWGGLGNQMFQYAFGRYLSHKHETELKFDVDFFNVAQPKNSQHVVRNFDLDIFNVIGEVATTAETVSLSKRIRHSLLDRALNKFIGYKSSHVVEPHFHYSAALRNLPDNIYLNGYWQSPKYFADVEDLIRADFTFKEDLKAEAQELLTRIANTNSVCVNVRRGDFVNNSFHGSKGVEYYVQAEKIIKSTTSGETYFVFSDDIEWCEANLRFNAPTEFVSHEYAGRKFQDYLRLMAACKHFVIPNSSFAWWAVWFNRNLEKTVIAPKEWFSDPTWDTSDLTPANWIRI